MHEAAERLEAESANGGDSRDAKGDKVNIIELQSMNILDQQKLARELGVADHHSLRKQELIFSILKAQTERSGLLFAQGVLEVLDEGFGFLRSPTYNSVSGRASVYARLRYVINEIDSFYFVYKSTRTWDEAWDGIADHQLIAKMTYSIDF